MHMRALRVTSLAVALAAAAGASPASGKGSAPPGNSGVQEYQEQVPTASGGQPISHNGGGGGSGGGSGGGPSAPAGGGGSSSSPASSSTSPTLSASTRRQLNAKGADGHGVVRVLDATSQAARSPRSSTGSSGDSPVGALARAITGGGGGLGIALPLLLAAMALAGALVFARTRRTRP